MINAGDRFVGSKLSSIVDRIDTSAVKWLFRHCCERLAFLKQQRVGDDLANDLWTRRIKDVLGLTDRI